MSFSYLSFAHCEMKSVECIAVEIVMLENGQSLNN